MTSFRHFLVDTEAAAVAELAVVLPILFTLIFAIFSFGRAYNVSGPRGIAIDASGNVWIANFTYNSVTEFVGAATPAATPLTPTNHGPRP